MPKHVKVSCRAADFNTKQQMCYLDVAHLPISEANGSSIAYSLGACQSSEIFVNFSLVTGKMVFIRRMHSTYSITYICFQLFKFQEYHTISKLLLPRQQLQVQEIREHLFSKYDSFKNLCLHGMN